MDNLGMFTDTFPACPFPKSFSFQIKKIGDSVKTSSAVLPDSTEGIKMFESPERDSEDFERSLKKTMECIAQVCDTTVPDLSNIPLKPSSNLDTTPLKPLTAPSPNKPSKPPPYPDPALPPTSPRHHILENIGREETVGPINCKKFSTPPHHPYQRPKRSKPDRTAELEENWLEAREIWERKQKGYHYPVEQEMERKPPQYLSDAEKNHHQYLPESDRRLPQINLSESDRKIPNYQPESDSRNQLFPGPQPQQQTTCDKKTNANPEHFIFPECNQDLQKEFFMFYMQKCLQQNIMEPPPYSAHGGPSTSMMTSRGGMMTSQASPLNQSEKRFVDSTTSPIHPQYLENKENFNHSPQTRFQPDQSCQYSSPPVPNQGVDVKPQRLHFNFPSPVPPPDQTGPPQTPNPATPIMGPSLDQSAAVLGPSPGYYNRTDSATSAGYPRTNLPESARLPHPEHSRMPQHTKLSVPLSESSRLPGSDHVIDRGESLSSIRPTLQHETKSQEVQDQRSPNSPTPRVPTQFRDSSEKTFQDQGPRDQCPRDQTPDGPRDLDRAARPAELHKAPHPAHRPHHLGGRPPNLPSHLFPNDTRPLQFHTPPTTRGFQPPLPSGPRSANLPLHNVRGDFLQTMRPKQEPMPQLDMGYFDAARSLGEGGLSRNTVNMPLDKAVPDNLAAGYLPYPDIMSKPYIPGGEFFTNSSAKERFNFSFKETIGKMLSKKKNTAASDINPAGKRTKFSNEQIRVLEHYYQNVNKYVTGTNKGTLCQVTGLELSTILMWFQNKRAREKKQKTNV